MLSRLVENWQYKLLAIIFACALHFYVIGQQNPRQSRTIQVPLGLNSLPPGLLTDGTAPATVSITLTGQVDALAQVVDSSVTASLDLSHAHAGRVTLPVHVGGVSEDMLGDVSPAQVTLILQEAASRRMSITATVPTAAPIGYKYHQPVISPSIARISGGHDAVESVQSLVVKPNADDSSAGSRDEDLPIVALDAEGKEVSGISLKPGMAHVQIALMKVPAMKTLLISADILGQPLPPDRITSLEITPQNLTVTGRPERLTQISILSTEPIDVSGAAGDIVRRVNCLAPPGVTLPIDSHVTVTVHIGSPAAAGLGPANTGPAASPSVPASVSPRP